MLTTTCDICCEPITEGKVDIELQAKLFYKSFDFCVDCARELIQKIADRRLINTEELEQFTSVNRGAKL